MTTDHADDMPTDDSYVDDWEYDFDDDDGFDRCDCPYCHCNVPIVDGGLVRDDCRAGIHQG